MRSTAIWGAVVVLILLLAIPALMLDGWVTFVTWNWFIPSFGLPKITYGQGVILSLLAGYHFTQYIYEKSEDFNWKSKLNWWYVRPVIFLALCWVVKYFLGSSQ